MIAIIRSDNFLGVIFDCSILTDELALMGFQRNQNVRYEIEASIVIKRKLTAL